MGMRAIRSIRYIARKRSLTTAADGEPSGSEFSEEITDADVPF
jgi:hypothetical protein